MAKNKAVSKPKSKSQRQQQQVPPIIQKIAGQLPSGITIKHPLPGFPPELDAAIRKAKQAGIYQVAVWHADENGTIHLHRTNSDGWQYGWHLMALKLMEQQILRLTPAGLGAAGARESGGGGG